MEEVNVCPEGWFRPTPRDLFEIWETWPDSLGMDKIKYSDPRIQGGYIIKMASLSRDRRPKIIALRWLTLKRKGHKPCVPQSGPADSEPTPRVTGPSPPSRVLNAVKLVLKTLSATSQSSSLPGLSLAFDTLFTVITKFEAMSENFEGFGDLVDRLNTLQSTLSRFDGAGKASADLDHLLDPLRREIESLRNDFDKAGSRGGLLRFIDSTDDASSLASHNVKLDRIISQLTLDVTTSTSHGVDQVLRSVIRVENVLSSRGEPAAMGMTQMFRGAKINTVGNGNGTGGHVGSGNLGMHFQDYTGAEIFTSGNVGANNISLAALESELVMRLRLLDMRSA